MTAERAALLKVLTQVQNDVAHVNRDILTITGCGMTDAEVADHIGACFDQAVRHMKDFRRTDRGRYVRRARVAA